MRIRSVVAVGGLAAAFVAALAAPALAHEEISPKTFPTGQPTFFTLTAANEHQDPLTGITLHAPTGLSFGDATRSPAGWSATKTANTITWKGGSVKPDLFETWGFEIDGVDQPGPLPFKVDLILTHSNGDIETEGAIEVDVTATPGSGTGGAAAGSTTTTGAATTTTAPAQSAAGRSDDSSGTAKAALALSIAALLAAVGALVLAGRRRAGPTAGGGGGAGPAAGGAQDW